MMMVMVMMEMMMMEMMMEMIEMIEVVTSTRRDSNALLPDLYNCGIGVELDIDRPDVVHPDRRIIFIKKSLTKGPGMYTPALIELCKCETYSCWTRDELLSSCISDGMIVCLLHNLASVSLLLLDSGHLRVERARLHHLC